MRTVLLGTDFVYNSAGNLLPIEINTNSGMNRLTQEEIDTLFNLNELSNFITTNNFTKVTYIGGIRQFHNKLEILSNNLNIEYVFEEVSGNITIPLVEDSETHLIFPSIIPCSPIIKPSAIIRSPLICPSILKKTSDSILPCTIQPLLISEGAELFCAFFATAIFLVYA